MLVKLKVSEVNILSSNIYFQFYLNLRFLLGRIRSIVPQHYNEACFWELCCTRYRVKRCKRLKEKNKIN